MSDDERSRNGESAGPDEERARAIALLEATHQFPVEYSVSIIATNLDEVAIEVRAAVEHGLEAPLGPESYQSVLSGGGKYSSHRYKVPVRNAEEVLALYARIKRVKGVVTVL